MSSASVTDWRSVIFSVGPAHIIWPKKEELVQKKNWSLKICLLNQEVDNANCDITICRVGRLWHKLEMGSTRSGWREVGSQSEGNYEHVIGTRWQELSHLPRRQEVLLTAAVAMLQPKKLPFLQFNNRCWNIYIHCCSSGLSGSWVSGSATHTVV